MQVAVHHFDAGAVVVLLDDDHRDRIVQLLGNIVAAVAGQELQAAALPGSGLYRLVDAVGLDRIIQVLVVCHLPVDGKRMVQKLEEIVRVQADGKALALLGDRQVLQCLLVWLLQPVREHLGDPHTFRKARLWLADSGSLCVSHGFGPLRGALSLRGDSGLCVTGRLWCFRGLLLVYKASVGLGGRGRLGRLGGFLGFSGGDGLGGGRCLGRHCGFLVAGCGCGLHWFRGLCGGGWRCGFLGAGCGRCLHWFCGLCGGGWRCGARRLGWLSWFLGVSGGRRFCVAGRLGCFHWLLLVYRACVGLGS